MLKNVFVSPLLLGLILAIFQTSFFITIFGPNLNINLVAVLCMSFLLRSRYEAAYLIAFICGIFLDILAFSYLGITPLILCTFVIVYKFINNFYLRSIFSRLIYIIICFYILKSIITTNLVFDLAQLLSTLFSSLISYLVSLVINKSYDGKQEVNF